MQPLTRLTHRFSSLHRLIVLHRWIRALDSVCGGRLLPEADSLSNPTRQCGGGTWRSRHILRWGWHTAVSIHTAAVAWRIPTPHRHSVECRMRAMHVLHGSARVERAGAMRQPYQRASHRDYRCDRAHIPSHTVLLSRSVLVRHSRVASALSAGHHPPYMHVSRSSPHSIPYRLALVCCPIPASVPHRTRESP